MDSVTKNSYVVHQVRHQLRCRSQTMLISDTWRVYIESSSWTISASSYSASSGSYRARKTELVSCISLESQGQVNEVSKVTRCQHLQEPLYGHHRVLRQGFQQLGHFLGSLLPHFHVVPTFCLYTLSTSQAPCRAWCRSKA